MYLGLEKRVVIASETEFGAQAASEPEMVAQTLLAGAAGYVTKRSSADALITAIDLVCRGMCPIDEHVAGDLLRELKPAAGHAALSGQISTVAGDPQLRLLSWPLSVGMRAALTHVLSVKR